MEILTETAERLKDIQKTNHEILLELAKLEEKQLRRRKERQHHSTTQKAPNTTPASNEASSVSKPAPVVEPVAQFTLTTEMMNYLCLLRRGKLVSDLQDNRLCEKFDLQPYKGTIMKQTDTVGKSKSGKSEKTADQPKVSPHAIPEKPNSQSGGQSSSHTQRSTTEGQRSKQAGRSKPEEHRSAPKDTSKKADQSQRHSTKSRTDGQREKAKRRIRQADQSRVPGEMSQEQIAQLMQSGTMVSQEQMSQLMQSGMVQHAMGGFAMAFNPLTGVMKAVDEADIQELTSQARTDNSQVVVMKSDIGGYRIRGEIKLEGCMRIVHGREMLRELISMMDSEEVLAELTPQQRELLKANRIIMQLLTENETVPFAQYMHVLGGVMHTEGLMDQVKAGMETTAAALQDPSRCHQVAQPQLLALPAAASTGSPGPRPSTDQRRALPPASSSSQSKPQSSSTVKTQPGKQQTPAGSSAGRNVKQPLTGSPNVAPHPQASGSQDRGGGGTSTGPGSQQRPAGYSHSGPALMPSASVPMLPGSASTTTGGIVTAGGRQPGAPMFGSGTAQARDTELTAEEEASVVYIDENTWSEVANQQQEQGATARSIRERGMDTIICLDLSQSMAGEPWKPSVVYIDENTWSEVANQQQEQGATARSIRERGMDTIICLDLSQSMAGEPWKQATAFIKGFIEGIQNTTLMDDVYEHVGLVTFGSETKVQQHMTCDYVEVLRKLGKLHPGGPSPLAAGMTMVYAALHGAGSVFVANGYKINPRVFLLTDGRPTPANMIAGPDKCSQEKREMEKFKIAEVLATIHKTTPITMNVVPLGDFDSTLLGQLAKLTGGKLVAPDDWESHTNTFRNYHAASKVGAMMKGSSAGLAGLFLDSVSHSPQDRLEMEQFLSSHKRDEADDSSDSEELPDFPNLGARVRRNIALYPADTAERVGTVTKHFDDGHIGVTWDEEDENGREREKVTYRDGNKGVIVCDEPRALRDELIAVGCRVRRGADWRYSDQDGGAGKLGSVFSVDSQGIVKVRWDVGRKNTYRFGQDGIYFDVEIVEDRTRIDKKPEKKTTEPADLIEEMNRKNKAASANIMDSMAPPAANSARRGSPASHRKDSPNSHRRNSPARDRDTSTPILKLGSRAGSGGRDSPARGSKNSPVLDRKASPASDRETGAPSLKLQSQSVRDSNVSPARDSKASPASDREASSNAGRVSQGRTASVEHGGTGGAGASRLAGSDSGASVLSGSRIAAGESGSGSSTNGANTNGANTNGVSTNGARPKAVLPPEEIKWCWNNNGTWQLYTAEVCGRIETSFRRNPKGTALVKVGDTQFRIVFGRMEQVNIETRDKFPVRRK